MGSHNIRTVCVDDASAIELLVRLVGMASPSMHESNANQFLVESMGHMGFDRSECDEAGNAVGQRQGPAGGRPMTIMLLGHSDTVSGWIAPRVAGDLLFGRGSVDAKGPLAAMVVAVARAKIDAGVRVIVVGAVEEEAASSKGARHIANQYRPDACIVGEPSEWDGYTLGYKGRLLIDFAFEQDEGHWAGQRVAAGERAIDWWNELRRLVDDFNRGRARVFDQVQLALRDFHTTGDGLRDRADVRVGLRLPVGFDRPAFERQLSAFSGSAQVRFHGHEEAWQSPRTSPLASAFSAAIRQRGGTPRPKLKTGTSDMNVVGPIWQCPIVAYGPGDSALDHAPNEHVSLNEYLRAIDVLQAVIESLPKML